MHPGLDQIGKAGTPAELWRLLRGYFRAKGYNGLAYFVASRGSIGMRKGFNIIHRGFPRAVSEAYIDEGLGEFDPGPAFALSTGAPIRWSRVWQMIDPGVEQQHFLERMRAVGLGDGYNLPVFGPHGRSGNIAVGNVKNETVLDEAPVDEMHLMAQAAHMRLCQLLPDRPPLEKPLSARELEILGWVARGKSNSVIADILSLSGATVDTYLRRIYDKLDVSDRTSAAVRGVGMGLITA
ncbi:MAG: autoinducer binding domain-containing protein [Sphingobium sp.]